MQKRCLIAGLVVCALALGSTAAWVSSRAEIETPASSFSRTPPGWEPTLPLAPGDIIEQHASAGDNPTGFEFDETNRCFYQGAWDLNIYELDTNFAVVATHPHFGDQQMPATGLAWYHGLLYQCNYNDGVVYQIDVSTWTNVGTVPSPGGPNLLGIEFVGDRMWLTDDDEFLYECDTLGNQINAYASADQVPFGMAYLPCLDSIWLCGWSGGNIYVVDLGTGAQTVAFPTPGSAGAYSCSGASFDDRYPVYLWIAHQTDAVLYLTDTGDLCGQDAWIDGTVTEFGTGTPIQDAIVAADGWRDTTDAAGYYMIQLLDGTWDVTASAFGYNDSTVTGVVLNPGDTVTVDFALTKPEIIVWPTSFFVSLPQDDSLDTTLYIYNPGTGPLDFDIEIVTLASKADGSVEPVVEPVVSQNVSNDPNASARDARHLNLKPPVPSGSKAFGDIIKQFNAPWGDTYAGAGLSYDPNTGFIWAVNQSSQTMYEIDPVAEALISTWSIPLALPWGCGFDGTELWVSDPTVTDDDYEFATDGSGPLYQFTPIFTYWAADMAFDGGLLWQIDVGSPGAVYAYDLTGAVQDTIQPLYSISQRGLACNMAQGTWYSGSWNSPYGQFWEFDDTGATVNYVVTGIGIAGLAWDYVTGDIWCISNDATDVIYELDSGYPAPTYWLDADPRVGAVAAGDTHQVTVKFNSTGLAAGMYYGELQIHNNSATTPVIVPCTLEVWTGVEEAVQTTSPRVFSLSQNRPNPTTGSTNISYQLPAKTHVSLTVYNAAGRVVRSLVNGLVDPGCYEVAWDGRDSIGMKVSSGVYFYRLTAGHFEASRKMVVLR